MTENIINIDLIPITGGIDVQTSLVGPAGKGVAPGGTTGQVLVKSSNADYDTAWATGGSGGGGAVNSVNGQTGTVVLTKADIGLSNADNTSDANKPVSTAVQTALNLKANTSSLSTVATSGSYLDLSNRPSIPNSTSDLTNDSGFITIGDVPGDLVTSVAGRTGAVTLTKSDVGLSNADNTSDVNKPISSATQTALNAKQNTLGFTPENSANKGQADGYASLDSGGKVPAGQLPSYIDDVLEYADLAAFPVTGEAGKIYVALDSNKTYRWSTSVYIEISPSPGSTDGVAEGSVNLYFTQVRARGSISVTQNLTYNSSTGVITGPDLTGFALSADLTSGLSGKEPTITAGTTDQYWRGDKSWATLDKSAVGLSNADNTSDANKPISTATQTALDLKANNSSLSTVATTGVYNDLTGKPTLVTTLDGLSDVVITSPATDQVLSYNGTNWVNSTPSGGSGGSVTLDDVEYLAIIYGIL